MRERERVSEREKLLWIKTKVKNHITSEPLAKFYRLSSDPDRLNGSCNG